jgi:protocatechuate 4,5-dioxygenase alpha chain
MLELGGNIYFMAKLGATDGLSFQQVAAAQCGIAEEEYLAMMIAGGRPVEGNRSRREQHARADQERENAHG